MSAIGSIFNSSALVANMQEQPAMAALATQNQALEREKQALEQKNAILEKQQAAMHLLFQQMAKQNERLATANGEGSALLKDMVQHLDNGQMARDAENELLRQEITLLKAQQEEANAQHADEIKRRDSHAEQRERRIAELEAKQQACQEFFHTVRTVSMSDFIVDNKLEGLSKRTAHLSPHTASIVEQRFRVTAASADALVLAVAKVQQDLLDICNLYRE